MAKINDMTPRLAVIFKHPKSDKDVEQGGDPTMVGVTIPWLLSNGPPTTSKGKPWIHVSTQIIQ